MKKLVPMIVILIMSELSVAQNSISVNANLIASFAVHHATNFETEFTNNASLGFESNQLNSFKKLSVSSKSANPYLVGNVGVGFVPRGTITTSEGYHNATTVLNNTITARDRRAAGLLGVGAVLMGGALGGKVPKVLGAARGYKVAWHNMQSNTYRNTSGRANKY